MDTAKHTDARNVGAEWLCKLLVLALCINKEGFIRYSSILEGNTADPKSLPDMIESLARKIPAKKEKTLIVMDAGIATEENLTKIKAKAPRASIRWAKRSKCANVASPRNKRPRSTKS